MIKTSHSDPQANRARCSSQLDVQTALPAHMLAGSFGLQREKASALTWPPPDKLTCLLDWEFSLWSDDPLDLQLMRIHSIWTVTGVTSC